MLKNECKELFMEMRDYSDNLLAMRDFIDLLKEFVDWNRGEIRVALINLQDYGFPEEEMFVVYNNMGGSMDNTIYSSFEFVNVIIDTLNEYDDEEYLEDFWIPRLKELFKNNEW